MTSVNLTITNAEGMHARPATLVVSQAAKFKSEIKLQKKDKIVNAKSIMGLLSLGIMQGEEITITAHGEDEAAAIDALKELILSFS